MTEGEILKLGHPDSGCKLARTMSFTMFRGLCKRAGDVCKECVFNPCQRMKKMEELNKQKAKATFGKHSHETNAEIAKRLGGGITSRQVSKMRKRGEL